MGKLPQAMSSLVASAPGNGCPSGRAGLTEAELAFYDALETNDSAVRGLGAETLRAIARELVRNSLTIDRRLRENVRAKRRVPVNATVRVDLATSLTTELPQIPDELKLADKMSVE